MSLFDRGREGELAGRGFGNLILRFGVGGIVVGPFALRVVGAVGEEFDSFYGLVPVRGGPGLAGMVVLHKGCADEGLAHVGDGFVAQVVGELQPVVFALADAFTAKEPQAFGVPGSTAWY